MVLPVIKADDLASITNISHFARRVSWYNTEPNFIWTVIIFSTGLKRSFSQVESSFPSPPEAGDDNVFYDSDGTNGESNGDIGEFEQPTNQDKQKEAFRSGSDDEGKEHLESPGNQVSDYRGKLPPLELLTRLFPTQKRGVLELILKGCHGDVLRVIECVLPSHERALASLKTPETLHYSPAIHSSYIAHQARSLYQGPMRPGHYPIYGSPPGFSYPMMEYLHAPKCSLGANCTAADQEHAYNVVSSKDQTNVVGKVCCECSAKCSPSSNFCSSCGKCFKET